MANAGSLADVLLKSSGPMSAPSGKNNAVNGDAQQEGSPFSGLLLVAERPAPKSTSDSLPSETESATVSIAQSKTNETASFNAAEASKEIAAALRVISDRLSDQSQTNESAKSAVDELSALVKDLSETLLLAGDATNTASSPEETAGTNTPPLSEVLSEILALMQALGQILRPEESTSTPTSLSLNPQESLRSLDEASLLSKPDLLSKEAPTALGDLLAEIKETAGVLDETIKTRPSSTEELSGATIKELAQRAESLSKKISGAMQPADALKETGLLSANKMLAENVESPSPNTPPSAPILSDAGLKASAEPPPTSAPLSFSRAARQDEVESPLKTTTGERQTIATDAQTKTAAAAGQHASFAKSEGGENSSPFTTEAAPSPNLSASLAPPSETHGFSTSLSSVRSTYSAAAGTPPAVDQVVLKINHAVKNGQSDISLQLKPGDLGTITIKLRFDKDDTVQGTVIADNARTLEMLQKDSRSLERALQDAGLRAEPGSLQFSLSDQQNQKGLDQAFSEHKPTAQDTNGTISAENTEGQDPNGTVLLSETYYISPTSVNIQV